MEKEEKEDPFCHIVGCEEIHERLNNTSRPSAFGFSLLCPFIFVCLIAPFLKDPTQRNFDGISIFLLSHGVDLILYFICLFSSPNAFVSYCYFLYLNFASIVAVYFGDLNVLIGGAYSVAVLPPIFLSVTSFGRLLLPSALFIVFRSLIIFHIISSAERLSEIDCVSLFGFFSCIDEVPSLVNLFVSHVIPLLLAVLSGVTFHIHLILSEIRELQMLQMKTHFDMIVKVRFEFSITVSDHPECEILEGCPQLLSCLSEQPEGGGGARDGVGLSAAELLLSKEESSDMQFPLKQLTSEALVVCGKTMGQPLRLHRLLDLSGGGGGGQFPSFCSVDFVYVTPPILQFTAGRESLQSCRIVVFSFKRGIGLLLEEWKEKERGEADPSDPLPLSLDFVPRSGTKSIYWTCHECGYINRLLKVACVSCACPRRKRLFVHPSASGSSYQLSAVPSVPEEEGLELSSSRSSLHLSFFYDKMEEDYAAERIERENRRQKKRL